MSVKKYERMSLPDAFKRLVDTSWQRPKEIAEPSVEADALDWAGTEVVTPECKKAVSLRLDAEVLEYFRMDGKGYQTRINSVLKAYVKARQG